MLVAGLRKVVDFQDVRYGREYLDRLKGLLALDRAGGGAAQDFRFTHRGGEIPRQRHGL